MNKNCSYYGTMPGKPVGSTINCPICQVSVKLISRNGQAYRPPHEPNHHADAINHIKQKVSRGTY